MRKPWGSEDAEREALGFVPFERLKVGAQVQVVQRGGRAEHAQAVLFGFAVKRPRLKRLRRGYPQTIGKPIGKPQNWGYPNSWLYLRPYIW